MPKKIICAIAFALALASLASCGKYEKKESSPTSGSSTLFCDDSFENIMEQEIDVFEYIYPDAHVLARYGTTAEAIDSLCDIKVNSIVIPRPLTDKEKDRIKRKNRNPRELKIAVDAVALIVNEDNPADNLSLKEVSAILAGEVQSWIDLDPHFPDRPIAILFDKPESAMMKYMTDSLLSGKPLGSNVYAQGSINGVVDAVRKDRSAIGVIGVSWLTSDLRTTTPLDSLASQMQDENSVSMADINNSMRESGVKVLGLMRSDDRRAYRPFQENIYNGTYPLTRSIYMVTVSPGGSPGSGFYSFVTGYVGQKLIMSTGVMPARMNINIVELVP